MLIKIKKKPPVILLILLVALLTRAWKINSIPALNPDEAALGYNAYSLISTGKDEHGNPFPLHFKSFGDYKPGAYVYLAMPFIKVLDLTPLAVRLPNLILSLVAIYYTYLLVKLLSKNRKLALLSATVLAFSPWHIHFSRGAWESSTALSFIIMALYYFYRYLKSQKRPHLLISVSCFSFSLYLYHSARIISPLLLLALFISHRKSFLKNKKNLIIAIIFGLIITLPVLVSFLSSGGTSRFGGIGITADPGPLSRSHELLNHHANTKLVNRIIHNKRVLYLLSWAQKYFSHFNLNFLFINGDEVPRSKVPEMGQLHLIELPLIILGLVSLLKKRQLKQLKTLLLSWLFIAPLASSLTFQAPSALRSLTMVVPLTIIAAIGLNQIIQKFKKGLIYTSIIVVYLFSFSYYLDAYFIHYPKRLPFAWQYGFDQLSVFLSQYPYPANKPIYITNKYDQPYILLLFFQKTSPALVQSQIKLTPPDQYGFSTVTTLGQYRFQKINWSKIPSNTLVIAANEAISIQPFHTIDFPSGQPAFKIYIKP